MVVEDQAGVRTSLVSADYFGALGVVPAWGRLLDPEDSQPGAPAVGVLGYQEWQTRWAADPQVVGRVVHVNNKPVQIVGVVPYTFEGLTPRRTALWFPAALRPVLINGSPAVAQDYSRQSAMLFGKLNSRRSPGSG